MNCNGLKSEQSAKQQGAEYDAAYCNGVFSFYQNPEQKNKSKYPLVKYSCQLQVPTTRFCSLFPFFLATSAYIINTQSNKATLGPLCAIEIVYYSLMIHLSVHTHKKVSSLPLVSVNFDFFLII